MATTSIHAVPKTLVRALAYISNADKTQEGTLIKTFGCSSDPDLAEEDFLRTKSLIGTGREKNLAQHMVISFKPNEITPQKAMEVGEEICDRLLKNQYQYMLAVHTDKKHTHIHVVFNNTNLLNGRSFCSLEDRKKSQSWEKLRTISDEICKENELSVIENPSMNKSKSWYEWDMNRQGQSWKSKLKFSLDECIMQSENFDDFLRLVREKGIEVSYNPEHKIDLKFKMTGQERWSRARTLGWYYETPQIKKRIEEFKMLKTGRLSYQQKTKIMDTDKFEGAYGLQRWANIQNMKEASRVINILTNAGVKNTDEIESKSLSFFSQRMGLVQELNKLQAEIDDVSDVIKNVRTFKKYKPYRDGERGLTGRKKEKYAKENAPQLEKYQSANSYLKEKFNGETVPSEKSLNEQRTALIDKRQTLNQDYKDLCKLIKDVDYARQTVEDYLKKEQNQEQQKKKSDLE